MKTILILLLLSSPCYAGIAFHQSADPAMVAEQSQLNLKAYIQKVAEGRTGLSGDLKWLFEDLLRDIDGVIVANDRREITELKRLVEVLDSLFGAIEPTSALTREWAVSFLKNFREPVDGKDKDKIQAFLDSLKYEKWFAQIMSSQRMSDDYYAMLEYRKVWDEMRSSIKAQVDALDRVGAGVRCYSERVRR